MRELDTQQTCSATSNCIQSILHFRVSALFSDLTTVRITDASLILGLFDPTTIDGWNLYLTVNYFLVYVCHGLIQDLNDCRSEKRA